MLKLDVSYLLALVLNILSCRTQGKQQYHDQLTYIYLYPVVSIQQSFPSYSPVCPGDNVVFICNVTGTILTWDYYGKGRSYLTGSSSDTVLGGFNIILVSIMNGMIRSEARLQHVTSNDNGRNINCSDINLIRHQATVIVAGKLTLQKYIILNITTNRYSLKSTKCHILSSQCIISRIILVSTIGEWTLYS